MNSGVHVSKLAPTTIRDVLLHDSRTASWAAAALAKNERGTRRKNSEAPNKEVWESPLI